MLVAPLVIGYPVLVYYSMQHYSARGVGAILLLGLSPFLLRTLRAGRGVVPMQNAPANPLAQRHAWCTSWHRWLWPVLALGLIATSIMVDSVRSLLLVPICINGALLLSFGLTLGDERPLVERFARLQHPDLTPEERQWCRSWTAIWTAFFAFNIVLASVFTLAHSIEWWTFYNGLVAYILMGVLFAAEYTIRKARFQRFDNNGLDRALRWCFVKLGLLP